MARPADDMAGAMAASSSTVDLSRLPAPTIVEQLDFSTIRDAMLGDLVARVPAFNAIVPSDPAYKLVEVAAYRELILRADFNDRARQLLVAFATGTNLDHLAGLVAVERLVVTPADAVTGVAAVLEADDDLRQRIVLAPEQLSVAGPELAYVGRAKDASADVLDASATSPAPGEVLVCVLSRSGDGTASAALLAAVRAVITDKAVRPLGDAVTVASAQLVAYQIRASLLTFAGPDAGLIVVAAQAALAAYLADNRKLGRDITLAGIIAALKVPGVQDVILAAPLANVVCGPTQAANATAIDVTHGGYAD